MFARVFFTLTVLRAPSAYLDVGGSGQLELQCVCVCVRVSESERERERERRGGSR